MKNLDTVQFSKRIILWLITLIICPFQNVTSQSYCLTEQSSNREPQNLVLKTMSEQGPLYLRIYVHVIRKDDGTGGQSVPEVYEALSFLDLDFNPHNIFFIWDCNIDSIDNTTYYNNGANSNIFTVNSHQDGIDIYLYQDFLNPPSGTGLAEDIPSKAFLVFGNYFNPPFTSLVRSHTISHEMGHCLFLYHTHQDWNTNFPQGCKEFVTRDPESGANCDVCGDYCCDTPADPNIYGEVDYETCTWEGNDLDPNQDPYDPDEHIIMSYSHPLCLEYFTPEEGQRMRNAIVTIPELQACIVSNCDFTINEPNKIWDTPTEVKGNLIIKENAKLTISTIVTFYPNSSVIVEAGGKLIINGGILTSVNDECHGNKMWKGVQVYGNSNENQFPVLGKLKQGYIELNNATIQNAICAVDLWKPGDYSSTGGIIKATNSYFINNARAIHALFYKNLLTNNGPECDYKASFTNCNFSITSDYKATTAFYKHIDLACVKGINFASCHFDIAQNVNGVSQWNQAIASYSSGFHISGLCTSMIYPCSNYTPTTFNGFHYGIIAFNDYATPYTFDVSRSDFINNVYGINVQAVKNEVVIYSNFKIGYNNSSSCSTPSGYGIYMNNSNGFAIEDNTLNKMEGAPQALYTGISTNFTNSIDDIYRNNFNGLSWANYANGTNIANSEITTGLTYHCNINNNNYSDIYAPSQLTYALQLSQGDPEIPAGNTFSPGATYQFYNGTPTNLNYYFFNDNSTQVPNPDKIYRVDIYETNSQNQCPTHYGNMNIVNSIVLNNQDKLAKEQEFASALANFNNVQNLYNNLKDGGSTEQIINEIATAVPQDMWSLRAELLGQSPHLSEAVLKMVADKTNVFSESAIFDILAANPDELRKEELIKYLEEKENPLPEYMIEILKQVATGNTYKTVLLQEMSRYNLQRTRAANDIIRSYLNDSIIDYNDLRNWLDNLGGIEADKQIISTYIHENNYESALSLASMLPQLYNLQGGDLIEHGRLMQIIELHLSLNNSGRVMAQLTNSEKSMLENIASNSNSTSGAIAKGILSYFYGYMYEDCLNISSGNEGYKSEMISPVALAKVFNIEINVKPNPASTWAAFNYQIPDISEIASLIINDTFGRVVKSFEICDSQGQILFDTRPLPAGIYYYSLKVGKKRVVGTLSVIK